MNVKAETVYVKWNENDLVSIKKAERKKKTLENKGYRLEGTMVSTVTGHCCFAYKSKKD